MSILTVPEVVTAPTWFPVDVSYAKDQSNVRQNDDDELFHMLIKAAAEQVQSDIPGGRQLATATLEITLPAFPGGPIDLPRPPLQSVTYIKYYDQANVLQTLDPSSYYVIARKNSPGCVYPAAGQLWPQTHIERLDAVQVRYVAGYATAGEIPDAATQAVLMLTDHWYCNRGAVLVGTISKELELGYRSLVNSCGWGGGYV